VLGGGAKKERNETPICFRKEMSMCSATTINERSFVLEQLAKAKVGGREGARTILGSESKKSIAQRGHRAQLRHSQGLPLTPC
jgi:hypothetical protein